MELLVLCETRELRKGWPVRRLFNGVLRQQGLVKSSPGGAPPQRFAERGPAIEGSVKVIVAMDHSRGSTQLLSPFERSRGSASFPGRFPTGAGAPARAKKRFRPWSPDWNREG